MSEDQALNYSPGFLQRFFKLLVVVYSWLLFTAVFLFPSLYFALALQNEKKQYILMHVLLKVVFCFRGMFSAQSSLIS